MHSKRILILTKQKKIVRIFRNRKKLSRWYMKRKAARTLRLIKKRKAFFIVKKNMFNNKIRISMKLRKCVKKKRLQWVRKKYFKIKEIYWNMKRLRKAKNKKFLYFDVYCRGFKYYRRKAIKRIYRVHKKSRVLQLPVLARTVSLLRYVYLVKIYSIIKEIRNVKITNFFFSSKNITEALVVAREKEREEEYFLLCSGIKKKFGGFSFLDSELDLYLGDIVWFEKKWSRLYWKGVLIKNNLKLYRDRSKEVQRTVKRQDSGFKIKKKVKEKLEEGIDLEPVCKNIRKLNLQKWLKKGKRKEDWYESWENLFAIVQAISRMNERERQYKERGKKIQERKKQSDRVAKGD